MYILYIYVYIKQYMYLYTSIHVYTCRHKSKSCRATAPEISVAQKVVAPVGFKNNDIQRGGGHLALELAIRASYVVAGALEMATGTSSVARGALETATSMATEPVTMAARNHV